MGTNNLKIKVVDLEDAPNYNTKEFKGLVTVSLDSALIVRNGTVEGNPTVDLLLTDKSGNQYIAMITGAILRSLCTVIRADD